MPRSSGADAAHTAPAHAAAPIAGGGARIDAKPSSSAPRSGPSRQGGGGVKSTLPRASIPSQAFSSAPVPATPVALAPPRAPAPAAVSNPAATSTPAWASTPSAAADARWGCSAPKSSSSQASEGR
eukprot:177787-Chlamydomonas_euryale.AAC.12